MINGFEEQTVELTEYELGLVPLFVNGLSSKIGPDKAVTNNHMVTMLKSKGHKVSGPRVRKIIHHIRETGLVERLIATSKGYYVSNDKEELESYIESLFQRAESIEKIGRIIEYQMNRKFEREL